MNKFSWFLVSALVSIFLFGCLERDLTFQIQYEELQGLKTGSLIYFQDNKIGQVQKTSYRSQGDYLVDVKVKYDFKDAATVNSKFYISDDPVIAESKAIVVEQQQAGGAVIEKGAIVHGSVKEKPLQNVFTGIAQSIENAEDSLRSNYEKLQGSIIGTSQELSTQLEGALKDVSRQFDTLNKKIQGVPDSEEVRKLEQSVKQLVDNLEKSTNDVHDKVKKQWVPALQEELDQLRERLKQSGREEEVDDAQRLIDEI